MGMRPSVNQKFWWIYVHVSR